MIQPGNGNKILQNHEGNWWQMKDWEQDSSLEALPQRFWRPLGASGALVIHLNLRLSCPFSEGWGYFGPNNGASKLSGYLISCSFEMFFTGNKLGRKEAVAGWLFGSTAPCSLLCSSHFNSLWSAGRKQEWKLFEECSSHPSLLLCSAWSNLFDSVYIIFPVRKWLPFKTGLGSSAKGGWT